MKSWADLREHLQETSGNHGLLWPLYDNSKICQALKSSPQFLAKSLSPCQPPKWFFWNVSEQEWAFTTRNGSFNTKKCLTFFFCGFILWACWCHPQMLSWVQRHLSSRLSVARPVEAALWCQRCRCRLLAELTGGIIPRMVSVSSLGMFRSLYSLPWRFRWALAFVSVPWVCKSTGRKFWVSLWWTFHR